MPNTRNMIRLRRGELTRMNHRAGKHTDVHIGTRQNAQSLLNDHDDHVQRLQTQLEKLRKDNQHLAEEADRAKRDAEKRRHEDTGELTNHLNELQEEVEDLREANAALMQKVEEYEKEVRPAPVKGVRIIKVVEITKIDDLVRLDCEFKPASGPLGADGAIILPTAEFEKLSVVEEG
jgi:DNA repair exonuclease SbcCD ATPase subunit